MLKAFKYRIYPNKKQEEMFCKHFGCVRFIFNKGLETKIKEYTENKKSISCFNLTNVMLKELKKENKWLRNVYSQCLQMSLRNLDTAFKSFFKKSNNFPKFKSKHNKQSYQLPQNVKINFDKGIVVIPKVGNVKCIFSRKFEGKIKTTTISKSKTNKYYVSILIDNLKELPIKHEVKENNSIGIDLGIKDFCILSNGIKVNNPKYLRCNMNRIRYLQSKQNHYKKGGSNRKRYNLKIAKIFDKISNRRNDFLHKLSTKIVSENQTIILEDLNVKGMMKNHKLAQAIGDVSWSKFVEYLKYKCEWYGKNFLQIGRFEPSSKTCNICGEINKELTLKDRKWTCPCGASLDRDINAALNIKNFGLKKFLSGMEQPLDAYGDIRVNGSL